MNDLQDHTIYLHSLVLITQYCIWKPFCSYCSFLPLTKLREDNFFLSHHRNLCPFYWGKSASDSKSTVSIFEEIYVNICTWMFPQQESLLSPKNQIKLLLSDEKCSLTFVFIMLTGHCKRDINLLIPWKCRGIFTIASTCLKGYDWRMQRNVAELL